MLYVQLDVNWPDHPKLIEAGLEGAGLHAVAMCLAKRLESDGWMHRALLRRHGATDALIDLLVDLELFDADGDRVRPHDWLDRNPSQAAIDARRATKAEAAKAGNHRRWGHDGDVTTCARCNPSTLVVAPCDHTGVAPESHSDPKRSPYTETETEQQRAIPPATGPDERRARLAAAASIIGQRAALRPGTRDPERTAAAVAAALTRDRHQDAYAFIASHPACSPEQLAEHLEPNVTARVQVPTANHVNASQHVDERIADLDPHPSPLIAEAIRQEGLATVRALRPHHPEPAA